MFKSIRSSLLLWHALVLAVALAALGTALVVSVQRETLQEIDNDLVAAIRQLISPQMLPPPSRPAPPDMAMAMRGGQDDGPSRPPTDAGPPSRDGLPWQWRSGNWAAAAVTTIFPWLRGRPDFDRPARERGAGAGIGFGGPEFPGPPGAFRDAPFSSDLGPPGGPPFEGEPNPLAQLPRDCLQRLGWNRKEQPYFQVWSDTGKVIRTSIYCPGAIPMPKLQRPAIRRTEGGLPLAISPQPEFRQRGAYREVAMLGPFRSVLVVGRSIDREMAYIREIEWILVGAGIVIIAIAVAGGWWLAGRAIRPLAVISETARQISGSQLARRINVAETQSELGSLAHTLNETFERLEAAFSRQAQFTADASHELRTPLSVILSQSELALSRDRSATEYRQSLEACLRASRRMKTLVESLLVLARSDAGKLVLHPEPVDLREAIEECRALLQPTAAERNIAFHTDLDVITIQADRTRIMQLMTNLLTNAIRYNREGGSVGVTLKREMDQAVVKVTDTGVGIAPMDQRYVFERFFRADKARSRDSGGSGLGLAICQNIVQAHGGEISFASKLGEGTTFCVRLPMNGAGAAHD